MSKFQNYQYPMFNMGFVPQDGVPHAMPVVRVVGPWAGTPEADALLDTRSMDIIHKVTGLRQHYYTGIVPMVRRVIDRDDYRLEYVMNQGQEIITIRPFPESRTDDGVKPDDEIRPSNPPDALVLEFIWDNLGELEPVPFWKIIGFASFIGIQLGGPNAAFPFENWCGPTFATVDGIPFGEGGSTIDGPVAQARFATGAPDITGEIGRAPAEILWENTESAPAYRGELTAGSLPNPPSGYGGDFIEISATGDNACAATRTGIFSPPPLAPSGPSTPWNTVIEGQGSYESVYRWQGYKDINPHVLIPRIEVAAGQKKGEYVGANGGTFTNFPGDLGDWDSIDYYGLLLDGKPYTDGRLRLVEFYGEPATKLGKSVWDKGDDSRRNSHVVVLDADWYRTNVAQDVSLDLYGFWKNPRNIPTNLFGRLTTQPQGQFPDWDVANAYVSAVTANPDTSWYDENPGSPSPEKVTIVATWLWGLPKDNPVELMEEAAFYANEYRQESVKFSRTVSAFQEGNNAPAAPNSPPWGTKMGRLNANFESLKITLSNVSGTTGA